MSEPNAVPGKPLSPEHVEQISGACTAEDLLILTRELTQAYENLVDFTSHVIERVAGQ